MPLYGEKLFASSFDVSIVIFSTYFPMPRCRSFCLKFGACEELALLLLINLLCGSSDAAAAAVPADRERAENFELDPLCVLSSNFKCVCERHSMMLREPKQSGQWLSFPLSLQLSWLQARARARGLQKQTKKAGHALCERSSGVLTCLRVS
jgi:hypothetical protein